MRAHALAARTKTPQPCRRSGAGAPARARPEVRRILHGSGPRIQRQTVPEPDELPRRGNAPLPYREAMEALERERMFGEPPSGRLCMTFDDGPQDGTEDCLDALAGERVPATFFLTGKNMASDPDRQRALVSRMLTEGHQIGNHTYTHFPAREVDYQATYGDLSDPKKLARFENNFHKNQAYFEDLLGASSPIFSLARLPGQGRFVRMGGRLVYVEQTEAMGMTHVEWDFEFGTSYTPKESKTEKASFPHLTAFPWQGIDGVSADHEGFPKAGDVILLHDRHWNGKQAKLEAVITKLKNQSFGFGKLDSSGRCS